MSLVPIAQWVLRIRLRRRAERRPHRGQSMVEFALIVPIFLLIILAFIEFSVAMSGMLNINFASRDAAAIAAQVGDQTDADCLILKRVEDDINRPTSRVEIQQVSIFRTDAVGSVLGSNVYERTGSTGCVQQDGSTLTVPYTIVTEGYPVSSRCRVLAGCGPGQDGLDTVGVAITYLHRWLTPIAGSLMFSADGFEFTRTAAMRMEPVL